MALPQGPMPIINRNFLLGCIEHLSRVEQALQSVQRVAQGAISNFNNEEHNVQTIRQDLERVARNMA